MPCAFTSLTITPTTFTTLALITIAASYCPPSYVIDQKLKDKSIIRCDYELHPQGHRRLNKEGGCNGEEVRTATWAQR